MTFSVERGRVQLVSRRRVDVLITGFDAAAHARSGDFVEVRDADGSRLSRVPVHTALEDGSLTTLVAQDRPR